LEMTLARLIPIHIHAALETALAPVLIVVPFVLGFDAGPMVVSVVLGVVMMGAALATGAWSSDGAGQQPPVRVSAHAGLDRVFALLTAASAIGLGFAGESVAAAFFGVVAIAHSLLAMTTRYTTARA
jgi:hypothetical protein